MRPRSESSGNERMGLSCEWVASSSAYSELPGRREPTEVEAYHWNVTRYHDRANLRAACAAIAAWLAAVPQQRNRLTPGFADALLGRWDLTVEAPTARIRRGSRCGCARKPSSWAGSSAASAACATSATSTTTQGRVALRVPVQYESDIDALRFEGTLSGDRIEGTTLAADGASVRFTGDARAGARGRSQRSRWREPAAAIRTAAI